MPIYEYRCTICGERYEVFQRSAMEATQSCPRCGGESSERTLSAPHTLKSTGSSGSTCCGREERCDKPPCSAGSCHRG